MTNTITLHIGDVRDVMATLPDGHADLLITSPPFLALRSYLPADHPDKHREIGSEPTPAAFIDTMLGLTADWGRLVPAWGSICVELGDTMSNTTPSGTALVPGHRERLYGGVKNQRSGHSSFGPTTPERGGPGWPLAKSMCLVPHLYTIGLAYGRNPLTGTPSPAGQWRIRNVITWARPNPPVGSLGKRNPERRTGDYKFRPACSYITVACRGTGRYFDLDAVRVVNINGQGVGKPPGHRIGPSATSPENGGNHRMPIATSHEAGAPPLDWHTDHLDGDWLWKLATAPYPGSHYATYPLTLPRRLVLAMCPQRVCTVCGWPSERISQPTEAYAHFMGSAFGDAEVKSMNKTETGRDVPASMRSQGRGGMTAQSDTLGWTDCGHNNWRPGHVLDPFGGSGTTAVAAALEGRDATLIDLDHRNVDLARRRIGDHLRIVDEHRDGDVVTWTVETAAPNQRGQLVGQADMLDLWGE